MCFRPPSVGKPIACPECGQINPSIAKRCIKCKTDLSALKDKIPCPECGALQPITNKVCGNCGFNGTPGSGNAKKNPDTK